MSGLPFKCVLTAAVGLFALCQAAVADMVLGDLHECYMFSDDRMIYKQPLNIGFEFSSCYMAIPVCGVPSGAKITPVVTMGTLSFGVTGLKVWTDKQMVDYYLADWNKGNDDDSELSDYDGTLGYETSSCSYEIDGGIWDIDEVRNRNVTPRADRRWILFKGKIPKGEWGGMKTFTVGIKGTDVRRGYAAYSTVNGTLGIRPGDFFNRVTASGYDTRYDFALEVCDADAAVSREYAGCEVAMGENYLTPLRLQIPEAGTLVYRGVSTYVLDYLIDVTGGSSSSRQTIYPADDKEALKKFGGSGAMEARWQFGGRATLESQLGILYFTQLLFFPANAKSVAIVSLQADYDEKHGVSVLRGYVKGSGTFKAGETARLTAVSGGALFKGWEVVYGALPPGVDLTKPTLTFSVPESMCGTADEQRQVTVRAVWVDKPEGRSSVSVSAMYNTEMGNVTGTGAFASGKKITLRATANKGFVFAGWYKDASFESSLDGEVDYRTPSFPYVVGVEDATVYAKFMPISDDVAVLGISAVEDEYAPKTEIAPIAVDLSGCVSLPTVTVKGLPPGLKFTAKALDVKATKATPAAHYDANTIYGAPTKSGVYETVITVTTAGKKTATETVAFVVIDRINYEHVLKIEADAMRGKASGAGIYAVGKKVTLKATVAKGYLFAGWYEDADCTQPLTGVGGIDHRTPSFTAVMPDVDVTAYAKFVKAEDDVAAFGISAVEGEYAPKTEIAPIAVDLSGCVSLPTVTVKGLPPGLKFTAKALDMKATKATPAAHYDANTIYGAPTKSGVYETVITVTTAGKKTATETVAFVIVDRAKDECVLKLRANAVQGKVTGSGVYAFGKKITLRATANKGFVFAGWYADERFETALAGEADYRSTPSFAVIMPSSDAVAYAAFVPSYEDASIVLHVDGRKTTDEAAGTVFNTSGDLMLPIYVKSASLPKITLTGLPSGLKFTTKRLFSRDGSMLADANTVYGVATKPGTYVVTAKLTNATVKKALERRFTIVVDNLTGANDYLRVTGADGHEVSLRNGRGEKYMVYMGVADHGLPALRSVDTAGKVTLAGLPAGLKYDAKTGKITGAATKVGTYTVTVTVRSGRDSFVSTFTVEVAPLPEWAVGTFVGAGACKMSSYESFEDNLYGTVTIAANGKISGKILFDTYEERLLSATFSSSAIAEYDEDEGCFYCDVDLVFKDGWNLAESRSCRMRIEPRSYDGTDTQTVGGISIDEDDFSLSLTQNVWKLKDFAGLPQFAESKTVVSFERELHGDPSVSGTSTLMLEIDSNGMVTATLIDEGMECGEPLFESSVTKGELLVLSHMSEPDRYQAKVALVFGNFGMLIADIEMRVSYDGKVRAGGCSITRTSDFADWSR